MIRRFHLLRHEDASGVSGTGVVAVGAAFPSGHCYMEWVVPPYSASWHENIHAVRFVHGHDGKTEVVWDDPLPREKRTRARSARGQQ